MNTKLLRIHGFYPFWVWRDYWHLRTKQLASQRWIAFGKPTGKDNEIWAEAEKETRIEFIKSMKERHSIIRVNLRFGKLCKFIEREFRSLIEIV